MIDPGSKGVEAVETLAEMAKELVSQEPNIVEISNVVLQDSRFVVWSGSSKPHQHHYGKGGLAEHTLEVVELSILNGRYFREKEAVPESLIFLAALFHDVGKMWDYQTIPTNMRLQQDFGPKTKKYGRHDFDEWQGTEHKKKIHHISRSAAVWLDTVAKYPLKIQDSKDEVWHAILAHHGLREWGSPVQPQSRLAWLLHLSDGLSARMDDCSYTSLFRFERH